MDSVDEQVLRDIRALQEARHESASGGEGAFWDALSGKHVSLIEAFGFRNFKRTINFEYSQWGVTSFRSAKIRRLAKGLLLKGLLPVGGFLAKRDLRDRDAIRWPDGIHAATGRAAVRKSGHESGDAAHFRAYAFYSGLLWQYALSEDRLNVLGRLVDPAIGNPLPVRYRGRPISQDLALGALEINRMAAEVPLTKVRRVLEIGAGYGRMAFLFRSLFPGVEYSILDIPPALAISRNYLKQVFGEDAVAPYFFGGSWREEEGRIRFMTPDAVRSIPDGHYDLVLNISSFDEMIPPMVNEYFGLLHRIADGWLYLKGFARSQSPGHRLGVDEFPYGERWRTLYSRPDPVVPGFVEKVLERAVSV